MPNTPLNENTYAQKGVQKKIGLFGWSDHMASPSPSQPTYIPMPSDPGLFFFSLFHLFSIYWVFSFLGFAIILRFLYLIWVYMHVISYNFD